MAFYFARLNKRGDLLSSHNFKLVSESLRCRGVTADVLGETCVKIDC